MSALPYHSHILPFVSSSLHNPTADLPLVLLPDVVFSTATDTPGSLDDDNDSETTPSAFKKLSTKGACLLPKHFY